MAADATTECYVLMGACGGLHEFIGDGTPQREVAKALRDAVLAGEIVRRVTVASIPTLARCACKPTP